VGESVNEMTKDRMTEVSEITIRKYERARRLALRVPESTYCHNPGTNPLSLPSPPG
jgi:hypothetical protein